jgi:RNA polymerase sigma factor (sigma-70 family)
MTFNQWIGQNSKDMMNIVRGIVKDNDNNESDELFQTVVLQLLENSSKVDSVPDHQKVYYFIRVVKNNYFSATSPYQYRRVKDKKRHIQIDEGLTCIEDIPYEEPMEYKTWVIEQLSKEELFSWYERDLFILYVELNSYVKVSKNTTIPVNSVSRHIKQIKNKLQELWQLEHQN